MNKKNVVVTGGAGFIGRWVVKSLVAKGFNVSVLDNLSGGDMKNLEELSGAVSFVKGDINDKALLNEVFSCEPYICFHLAASINVQDSIDDPKTTFENDVCGTFKVLEKCREHGAKMVFMSTCMVYDKAKNGEKISEESAVKPASPYAGSKIAGESLVLSYYHAYGLPAVVLRPFNTYGPFQKSSGEGGVVSIFINNKLNNRDLNIYGDGNQTRDLLYVEDCAEFVVSAGLSDSVNGHIVNAGSGFDVSVNELAAMVCDNPDKIKHVKHIHPQSEIQKLLCDYQKASDLLGFTPLVSLSEGIQKTEKWIKENL